MAEQDVSPQVRAFIAEHIESVMQLELLLLLAAHRCRDWCAPELADEMRIDPAWVETQLDTMSVKGLVRRVEAQPPCYRFDPRSPESAATMADLAAAYSERRVTVISLIFSKPFDKLRHFADAFRLRKDPSDG